jgi:predicted GNAT superfamily acetyltransferase
MTQPAKARLELRAIDELPGFYACLKLQQETWGKAFTDQVPPSVLMIAHRTGGLVLGAFVDGHLVGFVWGISGWDGPEKIHWSDMLAVKKAFRGRGIGWQLKLKQRQILKRRGVRKIYWTFDPLQTLNAHFNLMKLGVVVCEYRPNLYGSTHSPLHAGLDTDRFVATWDLQQTLRKTRRTQIPIDQTRLINPTLPREGEWLVPQSPRLDLKAGGEALYLEVARNFSQLRIQNLALARRWQLCMRTACLHYLRRGFVVTGFVEGTLKDRRGAFYVLEMPSRSTGRE